MCRIYLDWVAICCVDPTAVIATTTWKFEGVEAFVIEHCQTDVAIFRYCLEDEMPHERPLGDIRKFRIDLAQNSGAERLGRRRITSLGYMRRCDRRPGGLTYLNCRIVS